MAIKDQIENLNVTMRALNIRYDPSHVMEQGKHLHEQSEDDVDKLI